MWRGGGFLASVFKAWMAAMLRACLQAASRAGCASAYPAEDETWPKFAQRITRWDRNLWWASAKVRVWEAAITLMWGRAGHTARLIRREPTWCLASVLLWRGPWRRKTLRALNHSDTDSGRLRLGRWHRCLWARRWDEVVQAQAEASSNAGEDWMELA